MKKNLIRTFMLINILIIELQAKVNATLGSGYDSSKLPGGTLDTRIETVGNRVIGTFVVLFQVLSLAGIIIAGIRYIYSGASAKASLKKGLIGVIIGCIIVFGASTVTGLITGTFNDFIAP